MHYSSCKNKHILTSLWQIASIFIILFLLLIPLHAHAQNSIPDQPDFKTMAKAESGAVEKVIDPLTLQLRDGRILFLSGLDFPDLDYYEPGPLSVMALKILRDMLEGQKVLIYQAKQDEGRINRMGHHVAHVVVYNKDLWVQGVLLRLGLARVRTTASNYDLAEHMYLYENQARAEKSGLWKVRAYDILSPDNAHLFTGGFAIVEGTILKIGNRQGQLYLNFGHNWRKDFTVAIPREHKKTFIQAGLNPQNLGGQKIRVRGWLRSYNGPYIEIDHPECLEFIKEEIEKKPANDKNKNIQNKHNEQKETPKENGLNN
tara:strand:+ start:1203 stop:2150 length:948 start_codon:yes stop_codon:yes gene_type:complete